MARKSCRQYDWKIRAIEVMPDHVHLFLQIHHTDRVVDVVQTLKSITAVYVFQTYPKLKGQKFWGSGLWSRGTYYGTVGQVSQATIQKYIENQKN
jgi:putative transposase